MGTAQDEQSFRGRVRRALRPDEVLSARLASDPLIAKERTCARDLSSTPQLARKRCTKGLASQIVYHFRQGPSRSLTLNMLRNETLKQRKNLCSGRLLDVQKGTGLNHHVDLQGPLKSNVAELFMIFLHTPNSQRCPRMIQPA